MTRRLLILIFVLGLLLRTWQLSSVPPGFNQDEAANAFDPLSLWHSGETYTGDRWPVFFDMYGDYNEGLYYYLNLPFYVMLGNRPAAARLPIALMGALAVLALYFLARQATPGAEATPGTQATPGAEAGTLPGAESRSTALVAAALLAISPWAILASRITLREMLLPLVWFMGLAYFMRAVNQGRALWPAAVWLALTFYTYTPVRLFVPLMMIVLAVEYRRELRAPGAAPLDTLGARRCATTASALLFLIILSPFLYWLLFRTSDLLARASAVDIFEPEKSSVAVLLELIGNWLEHYDPRYLFQHGGDEPLFTVPGWGILFAWTAPFVLIGLVHALYRRSRWDIILLAWLVSYPIADALTQFGPHPQRAIAGVGLYELLAARGLMLAFQTLSARKPRRATIGACIVGLVAVAELAHWSYEYFGKYPLEHTRRYYDGLDRIFHSPELKWEQGVVVSERIHRGSMQLFYHLDQWGPQARARNEKNFPVLMRPQAMRYPAPTHYAWGSFAFGNPFLLDYPGAVYVLHSEERGLLPALDVARDRRGAAIWAIVADADLHAHAPWMRDGSPVLRLLDVELSRQTAHIGDSLAIRYRLAQLGECNEPLGWATHFFSGDVLWPHDVTMERRLIPGETFDVLLETVVPDYAKPGEYRIFAGPVGKSDAARLLDATGADFHSVGSLLIRDGSAQKSPRLVWERDGNPWLQLLPPGLPEEALSRGERFTMEGETDFAGPLTEPLRLEVSFFAHGSQWSESVWLRPGSKGPQLFTLLSRVPRNAKPGEYSVHVGLYDPARDRLLLLQDGRTRAELGRAYVD